MLDKQESKARRAESLNIGEFFVKEGLIHRDDVDRALSIQEKRHESLSLKKSRLFGMILCDLNLVTPMDNYYVLSKYNKLMTLQAALVSRRILTRDAVVKATEASNLQKVPFVSYLLKNKLVSTIGLQRLLFDLFHIPFRSISDFVFNKTDREHLTAVIDEHTAQEKGIIPLKLRDNTILLGITDPETILFARQLNDHFPQYRFKLLFIAISGFSWFHNIIYDQPRSRSVSDGRAKDVSRLLDYQTDIEDPDQEGEAMQTLYLRYEQLHHFVGNPKKDDRYAEFNEFIGENHKKISKEYNIRSIRFSLKKENKRVQIVAFPKR